MKNWLFLMVLFLFSCETHLPEFDYELTGETPVEDVLDTSNFIVWYPFNGGSNDESQYGLDATVYEATLDKDRYDVENSSFKFDISDNPSWGERDDILITEYDEVMDIESFSLFAWVKMEEKLSPYNDRPYTIMSRQDGGGLNNVFSFKVHSDGEIVLQIGNHSITSNYKIDYNEWYHVIVSYSNGNVNFYVDSALVASLSTDAVMPQYPSHLTIGETWQDNGYWYHFNGGIDDVGISNGVLTEEQIKDLYNL